MTTAAQRGTTTVTDRAVRRIAERAAEETLAGRTSKAAASVDGHRARVALDVTLPYPAPLTETVRGLREHVVARTRELTGLDVPAARIRVTSLAPVAGGTGEAGTCPAPPAGRTPRRLWSRRRVPAAAQAALAAAVCGALALDLVMVHAAHRPAAGWRVAAAHWLSEHGPGDRPVAVGGGLAALLGLWMIVLAVTPGLRRRVTVRSHAARVVVAVDRPAVEALVRDAVGEVAGVGAVRVRVRRHRVSVRAGLLFGDRAGVRADVTAAAGGALASCGLRQPHRPRVRVTPSAVRQPPAPDAATAPRPAAPGLGALPEGEA
ncbi:DUF6286 domain-containing Asp23/Gls24 family envelope stress response protein [Streptomyces malaysiense]|uniref:DUF6286 domain-containing protein n=1 Tax=Streptomyces malaysiense TaxID=1428626 RepID=A0A1J4PZP7_9ACTN|nr:DUF6286 domain-containing protein [Streptomyces malaysiense]OIK26403.1 hypothetical protein VT52_016480 [Streptomyces malaysiense]